MRFTPALALACLAATATAITANPLQARDDNPARVKETIIDNIHRIRDKCNFLTDVIYDNDVSTYKIFTSEGEVYHLVNHIKKDLKSHGHEFNQDDSHDFAVAMDSIIPDVVGSLQAMTAVVSFTLILPTIYPNISTIISYGKCKAKVFQTTTYTNMNEKAKEFFYSRWVIYDNVTSEAIDLQVVVNDVLDGIIRGTLPEDEELINGDRNALNVEFQKIFYAYDCGTEWCRD